jgi:BNR repeat-like domain
MSRSVIASGQRAKGEEFGFKSRRHTLHRVVAALSFMAIIFTPHPAAVPAEPVRAAGPPFSPRILAHAKVYAESGRFAGWPANHGIWSWGDEILVGFSRGFLKDNGAEYHIDAARPEDFLFGRSRDGGLTWKIESPNPPGILAGTRGMRHAAMPQGMAEARPISLGERINFGHPDFALVIHMEHHQKGASCFYVSYNRGRTWNGPYALPMFGQKGVMGRTDYLVKDRNECLLFLTVTKSDGTEGRPICARTRNGGMSWQLESFIGPEPSGYAVMPSTVRLPNQELVTTVRLRDFPKRWIDAYHSIDDGKTWSFLSTATTELGSGNPPCLSLLRDGRLILTYGYRAQPFGIHAILSTNGGVSWSKPCVLRTDGGSQDIGYPRSVVRPDGRIVTVYAFHDRTNPNREIEAMVWEPGD